MGRSLGPGPGGYTLPSTLGYNRHDPRYTRSPQYSFGKRFDTPGDRTQKPGPEYNVARFTQHGKSKSPAYSLSSRPKPLPAFSSPGPAAYCPENAKRARNPSPPAYSMGTKLHSTFKSAGPGPVPYGQPTMYGKVCNKNYDSMYTMM